MGDSRASLQSLLLQLPRPASADWPEGEPFVDALRHGTMSLEIFAPRGIDRQSPHEQDELYIVVTGEARFNQAETISNVHAGDALFVPAGVPHNFFDMSADFVTWVVFWGPKGGERSQSE